MRKALVHVILPIVVGAATYLVWRSPTLLVFHWMDNAGLGGLVAASRASAFREGVYVPQMVTYTLPDALWVYSLTAAMMLVWRREPSGLTKRCWICSGLVLALASELGQALRLVPGTFDPADLAFCVIAAVAAVLALSDTHQKVAA